MSKLILLSAIIGMVSIPTRAARAADPMQGLRQAMKQTLILQAAYAFALVFVWKYFS
jgi:hypothetical protein